ncbi:hypothetical protein [Nitrosococcus wardiae]|uniref:Bacteriocin n=1 Tax=Nitrosococcus wardiae TaxID=1814290 RepID=A0A4P7C0R7_9GAMM|nr:hypothetical protein [Nitrosococcus wardiae]QBQ56178.1 hypothetical protein E3U44_17975 [Nitrosococcus wardiae]
MTCLIVQDLERHEELDNKTMASMRGGSLAIGGLVGGITAAALGEKVGETAAKLWLHYGEGKEWEDLP